MMIATAGGIGFAPIAPGSCAALVALPVSWAIRAGAGVLGLVVATVLVILVGWWAAGAVAAARGEPDPGMVVIDEIAGQMLALLAAPRDPGFWVLSFVLFRLFDIAKPWPVGWADRHVKGGLGILLDDLLAAGYAVLVLEAVRAIAGVWRVQP
jgi:phosphatidylglycerophosphatase A